MEGFFIMQETWKVIPGFDNRYEVSNFGNVRSFCRIGNYKRAETPKILSPGIRADGRKFVSILHKSGIRKTCNVHRLVMLAFVGERPNGMEVCHNDGNPGNNHINNLRYDTTRANARDICYHNRRQFSPQDIITIKYELTMVKNNRRAFHEKMVELINKFNTTKETIYGIANGNRYGYIKGIQNINLEELRHNAIIEIRETYAKGTITLKCLADKYGYDESAISLIVRGKRFSNIGGPIKGIDY